MRYLTSILLVVTFFAAPAQASTQSAKTKSTGHVHFNEFQITKKVDKA